MAEKTRIFVCPDAFVPPQSPPTSYAIAGMLNGEPDGFFRVVKGMVQRTAFIAPGLWIAGIRDPKQLVKTSLITSTSISALLIALFAMERAKVIEIDRNGQPRKPIDLPAAG
jgi:hypothetical protein